MTFELENIEKKFSRRSKTLIAGAYFVILLSIALWIRDIPGEADVFNTTFGELIKISKFGDPASFATAAIDVAQNGWISSENSWIINLWPPGFIMLEALIIKVFGADIPAILALQIFTAGLFSVIAVWLCELLSVSIKNKTVFFLPLLIFFFPVARVFLLGPTGVTFGENFSIGFFLLFILLTLRSLKACTVIRAASAGIFLALSAYFRSQFEIILLGLTAWAIILIIAFRLNLFKTYIQSTLAKTITKSIVITLLVAHALTLPWRMYHWAHQGSPAWVFTSSVTFGNAVMTDEALKSKNGAFVVSGGGNLVCKLNPSACGNLINAKKLFIKTFLSHPFKWISFKASLFPRYWFSSVQNWTDVYVPATLMDKMINGLIIIAMCLALVLLATSKIRNSDSGVILIWLVFSLISTYLLIFTVQQFEVRYFYFPKIIGLVITLITICLYIQSKKNRN